MLGAAAIVIHERVSVGDMRELVRDDGFQLGVVEVGEQALGDHHHAAVRRASGGKRVGDVRRHDGEAGNGKVGKRTESLHHGP
jgi:hypothetical protein